MLKCQCFQTTCSVVFHYQAMICSSITQQQYQIQLCSMTQYDITNHMLQLAGIRHSLDASLGNPQLIRFTELIRSFHLIGRAAKGSRFVMSVFSVYFQPAVSLLVSLVYRRRLHYRSQQSTSYAELHREMPCPQSNRRERTM